MTILQPKIENFVIKLIDTYDKEQLAGLIMLEFNLFYDEAKESLDEALTQIRFDNRYSRGV